MRGSCLGPVRRRRGRAPALGVSRASVPTVPSVGRAPQRAALLAQPREHLAHEPEHQEHQPGESEQQHQIEKRPVALLEHETLDQRVDGDQEAEEDQHGPGHAEEQHRLAPEAELEPHGEKVQYPDGNATDPELRLPRPARRKPWAAAITTMKRCQSGRVVRPSITSRRYALTEFRSVTRTPNSQRHSPLYTHETNRFS